MPRAMDLLREGRDEELWQMCCGFLKLNISEFMDIQRSLLLQQLELLNNSVHGKKIMRGRKPITVEEFRQQVPLTTYEDYCPELMEKREDTLPQKPERWARTSGRSGDYPYKWIPITQTYTQQLSTILYGVGMLSCCREWGDTSRIPSHINLLYGVAPRPYISGTFADVLRMQTDLEYLPPLEIAEDIPYEDRIATGFQQALSRGLDYFFGLSLVLVKVGEKLGETSSSTKIRPYLGRPRALWRLARAIVKSRLAGRQMLPKDIWSLRGIIGSGVDSWVYKEKIKELWGINPLDIYSCTEGGVIATQTWDYGGMTFIPNINFLEFIPEDEILKWQMDRSYRMKTLLLDEVKAGECYEIVITNFHGGSMVRYRIGDMINITALENKKLGVSLPQMTFERRVDDVLYFVVVKLTEKQIWQAIEKSGLAYEDWVAYKVPGESVMHILIEPKSSPGNEAALAATIQEQVLDLGKNGYITSGVNEDWRDGLDFGVEVTFLPQGTFKKYTLQRQSEGADLAHFKPPHLNPPEKVLSQLTAEIEETIIVTKSGDKAKEKTGMDQVTIA